MDAVDDLPRLDTGDSLGPLGDGARNDFPGFGFDNQRLDAARFDQARHQGVRVFIDLIDNGQLLNHRVHHCLTKPLGHIIAHHIHDLVTVIVSGFQNPFLGHAHQIESALNRIRIKESNIQISPGQVAAGFVHFGNYIIGPILPRPYQVFVDLAQRFLYDLISRVDVRRNVFELVALC